MSDFPNDIKIDPPEVELHDSSETKYDFDWFLQEVSSLLPFVTVKEIAPIFRYSKEEIGKCESHKNPGYAFVVSLNQKHSINSNDISKLISALKFINEDDIAEEVFNVFRWYREKVALEALKKTFIKELKTAYRESNNNLQPMPFRKDKRFLVDQLFIDRGIYLGIKEGIKTQWDKLESYHRIFDDPRITSSRIILSARAGYGKSTLALKFASDWSNKCKDSPLSNVEILIFLRLRKLDSSVSIFKAIQTILLSDKSKLSESDVEKILCDSQSVVLVLEGFDKYKTKGKPEDDDVINILKGQMFPNCRVILTTTISCKPDFMDPTTAEVILRGFDSKEQERYICKALVINNVEEIDKVRSHIKENSVMRDLCEVPFIFAMVLNMIQDQKEDGTIPFFFQSVTGFLRFAIGSIYEHKKNKMREEDRQNFEQFKDDHHKLDKVCFETLKEEKELKKWIKDELEKKIGKDLCDRYIALEILMEEEVLVVDTSLKGSAPSLIERKTKVGFYHKLFMQWFAAHYIAQRQTKLLKGYSDSDLKKLLHNSFYYVFMFACGINPRATVEVVSFLKRQSDVKYGKLIKLCEQEGKHGH